MENINNLNKLLNTLASSILLFITGYSVKQWWIVKKLEALIVDKQKEIDNVHKSILTKCRESLVTQPQLDKMVLKKQEPLKRELRDLKQNRQFLLEKIPLLSVIKQ